MNPYETRDSQLKAFHTAERRARARLLKAENPFVTLQYDPEFIKEIWHDVPIEVSSDRGVRTDFDVDRGVVVIGKGERTAADIVHACAHRVTPREYAKHGPEFISNLLELIEHYFGGHVRGVYEQELRAQKQLRFTPSHKPAAAFLNYAKNHGGIGRQVVLVYLDDRKNVHKVTGEYCGITKQKKTGTRVARLRTFGSATERDIPIRQLRYAFWPRKERKS